MGISEIILVCYLVLHLKSEGGITTRPETLIAGTKGGRQETCDK